LTISFAGKKIPLKSAIPIALKKLGIQTKKKIKITKTENHMNPLDYWYETNDHIKKFQDHYFKKNIVLLKNYPKLEDDVLELYTKGSAIEKNQALTLLSGLKQYF